MQLTEAQYLEAEQKLQKIKDICTTLYWKVLHAHAGQIDSIHLSSDQTTDLLTDYKVDKLDILQVYNELPEPTE